jgi:hypothetical protein
MIQKRQKLVRKKGVRKNPVNATLALAAFPKYEIINGRQHEFQH